MLRNKVVFLLLVGVAFTPILAAENICRGMQSGARVPLAADCSKFIVCLGKNVAEIGSCPRGLHFNRALGECDFQWRAGCAAGITAFTTRDACACDCCADTCGKDDDDFVEEESTPTPTPSEISTDCVTSDTTATTKSGSASDSDSDSSVTPTAPSTSTTATIFIVPAYCDNSRTECVNQPDNTVLLVEGQCQKFITCNSGCAIVQECPNNLQYQINGNYCDYPSNVKCTPNPDLIDSGETQPPTGPSGTTCDDPDVCRDQRDGAMFANPNTNGYFICQCECPIAMPCDKGLVFNETIQVCDWDKSLTEDGEGSSQNVICPDGLIYNATNDWCDYPADYVPQVICDTTSDICLNQKEGTLFPVNGVCNKFYKCNYNCAVEQLCPNNLIYNTKTQMCDYPQNVKCSWPYTAPSGPNAGPSGRACESGGRCVGQNEGTILPSLTDCNQYIVCQCECEVPMTCPVGLNWDQQLKTCNYQEKVTCVL